MQEEEVKIEMSPEESWLEEINNTANEKVKELEEILKAVVIAVIYVIEPGKDACVGYLRKPDAKQCMKIMRSLGEHYETGVELMARSQLIREVPGYEGSASDPRFMDVNGNYLPENTDINLNLMLDAKNKLMTIFVDHFKKK